MENYLLLGAVGVILLLVVVFRRKRDERMNGEMKLPKRQAQPSAADVNHSFSFAVEDVFSITGRGTVATGIVRKGQIRTGSTVTIKRTGEKCTIKAIEAFRKVLDTAMTGEEVGLMLSCGKNDVQKGDIIFN